MSALIVADFISHPTMHLPFNESYLALMAQRFPDRRIVFAAQSGHLENIGSRLSHLTQIEYVTAPPLAANGVLSRHNPIAAIPAARACIAFLNAHAERISAERVAVLGFEGYLYRAVCRLWSHQARFAIDLIMHGQLGDSMIWRSRNPIYRRFDIQSQLQRPCPKSVTIHVLELGIADCVVERFPHLSGRVQCLEHPILESDWRPGMAPDPDANKPVVFAFLGNARRSKGFGEFIDLAKRARGPHRKFITVGEMSKGEKFPDMDCLDVAPARAPLSRIQYMDLLCTADLVCLPYHSAAYNFTASGTMCDAIAALRPVIAIRSRTMSAVFDRYGPFGILVDSIDEMLAVVESIDRPQIEAQRAAWQSSLERMRAARTPVNAARRAAAEVS
ncbi:MAG: hypothetical protein SFV21_06630 [Rhodospirillaceae bacterium]|nr:hypothetical protein [Rhodospirillaceae bacterium]